MTPELTYLAYSVALLFVLVMIQATAGIRQHGGLVLANNRDGLAPANTFSARTKRLVDNMRENMWFFAPLVLTGAAAGISNEWTVLGAQVFFFARVIHALIYLSGLPIIRPFAWLAGVIGCALIFLALFGILA